MTLRAVLFATSFFSLILIPWDSTAAEWYVDVSVAGSGNGQTWGTAFKTIREGISGASDGDTVIVAQGEYVENIYLDGKNIILRSTDPLDPDVVESTVIDGSRAGSVVTFAGTENETCVVSGFTILNGRSGYGGGIDGCRSDNANHATIQNNSIRDNSAEYGGGLSRCGGTIENNIISGNRADYNGGGLYRCDGIIESNLISGNWAMWGGGLNDCQASIDNNTITGNSAWSGGGVLACWIGTTRNCIIWGNSAPEEPQIKQGNPSYCCIQDWTGGGEGNIAGDPRFVDPDGPDDDPYTYGDNDYRLSVDSPCIDAGQNEDWMWEAVDLDGSPRILNGTVDMGAYEFRLPAPMISGSHASLSNWCEEGSNAESQSFEVWNSEGGTLSYSISDDVTWLSCSPSGGTSMGEHDSIEVTYATSGLSADIYSATITISAPGASNTPQTIPVTMTVNGPVPLTIWYVDGSLAVSGDGTSWETALKAIQEGIDGASDGDTVIVAQGEYVENIYLDGKNIILRSTDPLDPDVVESTVIDGSGPGSVVTFAGTENETCVLSGFTILNGKSEYGGGIDGGRSDNPNHATVQNNSIRGNWAEYGGGLYGCGGTIQKNTISGNGADYGGGLYGCGGTIQNNSIRDNWADYGGGGLYGCDGIIKNNIITNNITHSMFAARGGGGLYDCDGIIQNNIITGNLAIYNGGGGLCGCDGTIRNNTITRNLAPYGPPLDWDATRENNSIAGNSAKAQPALGHGGGLYGCYGTIENNTISWNGAEWGGGLRSCSGTVQNNTISGNSATWGGGLYGCGGTIQKNTIDDNLAWHGGGLYDCDGLIQNNTITGNWAESNGGGLYDCDGTVHSNIITGNRADYYHGGALRSCHGTVQNNTITGNSAVREGGGLYGCGGRIVNCIIWGNSAADGAQLSRSGEPTYCCVQDWTGGGEGNTAKPPGFVDPDGPDDDPDTYEDNNYHLAAQSPCIDAGKNEDWMWKAFDLDGNPRIWPGRTTKPSLTVDMGAYEYGSFPFKITQVVPALTWRSRPGDTYTVQSCTDLSSGEWTDEETVLSDGESTTWTDTDTESPRKFYRIEIR